MLADKTTGLFLTYSIAMALFHRERTGEGQRLHVPMYESFAVFRDERAHAGPHLRAADRARGLPPHADAAPPPLPDRRRLCLRAALQRPALAKFFAAVGRPELADDPRFADQPSRSKNIDALYAIVTEVMPTKTSAEWLTLLEEADIPVMPMNTPEDLFDCPHLTAVGMFPVVDHPTEGKIRHIKVPVHFSKTPGGYYRHPERWARARKRCWPMSAIPPRRSPSCRRRARPARRSAAADC